MPRADQETILVDANALRAELAQMGVAPVSANDPNRPALYLPELRATRTFLTQTLAGPGGLGNRYAFCRRALASANLLSELGKMLDLYIGPAVNAEMDQLNPVGQKPAP